MSTHRYYRNIHFINEKRQQFAAEDQGVTVRGKRRNTNLPDDWDDCPKWHHRNWKEYRKTQYK